MVLEKLTSYFVTLFLKKTRKSLCIAFYCKRYVVAQIFFTEKIRLVRIQNYYHFLECWFNVFTELIWLWTLLVHVIFQDEEQDPLLHGFSQLKDHLCSVSGNIRHVIEFVSNFMASCTIGVTPIFIPPIHTHTHTSLQHKMALKDVNLFLVSSWNLTSLSLLY